MKTNSVDDSRACTMSIEDIQKGYNRKDFTVKEVVRQSLMRIERLDKRIGAILTVCGESALEEADKTDERMRKGKGSRPLEGIPIVIKDNIYTRGIKTTCASRMLEDFIPAYDATIVKKLRDAGAILIGKANLDEFAMGSTTETSAFKITCNPWDLSKVPGGSSGGSAAAVAAGFAPLAIGTDTGGSIRQPAAFCGTVGLKPTYGTISRYGLIPFASSLDHIGPITGTVSDCAVAFQALTGQDPNDATSVPVNSKVNYIEEMKRDVGGLKIGIVKEYFNQDLDPEIGASVQKAAQLFEQMGARVEEISLPIIDCGISAYYIISSAEASTSLADYGKDNSGLAEYGKVSSSFVEHDGRGHVNNTGNRIDMDDLISQARSEIFGREIKSRIMLGTLILSEGYRENYLHKANLIRKKIGYTFQQLFQQYDFMLMPTTPALPGNIGEKHSNPLEMMYTAAMNMAGVPALSMPCGFSRSGLPIGLQLVSDRFAEDILFRGAFQLEQELGIINKKPDLEQI